MFASIKVICIFEVSKQTNDILNGMNIVNYPSVKHSILPEQGKSVAFKHYRHGWLSGIFTTHTAMGACFFAQRDDFNNQWGWFDTESVLEWKY